MCGQGLDDIGIEKLGDVGGKEGGKGLSVAQS